MTSDGNAVDNYLRIVRVHIDALGCALEDALQQVPESLREDVRARWEEETALPIQRATVLSGRGGPRAWFDEWNPAEHYYWPRLREYLIDGRSFTQRAVESLDDATDKILSHLEDPRPDGPREFNVRGLVMGYVQSGKTANYCALLAKAADLGYKLIIVLSGIHNSLRRQTQRRVNRALGIDPSGVSRPAAGRRWIALTQDDLHGDFRPGTVDANILQGNEQVLCVVKKNATVLRRLTRWMGNNAPASLPVLVIDDEADQASINTGGNRPPLDEETDLDSGDLGDGDPDEELDPSVINRLVRSLLASFHRVSYVAYTATPFANILINHDVMDREVYESLYPGDFILALPRPHGYAGAEVLFGRDPLPGETGDGVSGLDVINLVPEHEADRLTPSSSEVGTYSASIVTSMQEAFLDFVLASAARHQRTGTDGAASMLIHTHHRTAVQNRLGEAVRQYVAELRNNWRYSRSSIRPALSSRWNESFRPVVCSFDASGDATFEEIEPFIDQLFRRPLQVFVLNSASEDELDYEADPEVKAIVVGGNRLSRGLTLEGLLVSYYVRRARYFDTLMQMGRWFGFRRGHVDLTRIWTTEELAEWFRDLALAEEELRREAERYEREDLTPLDFGLRIRSHPAMMITSQKKMGSARLVSQNYSAYLLQTTSFRFDNDAWLRHNLEAAQQLVQSLGVPHVHEDSRPEWHDVPWGVVDQFLREYWFDPRGTYEMGAVRQYLQEQSSRGELIRWTVSVRGRPTLDDQLGTEPRLSTSSEAMNRIARTRLKSSPNSIGSLVNPAVLGDEQSRGDEEVGLTSEQRQAARREADRTGSFPRALRRQRSPEEGLLLIYPISPYSRPRSGSSNRAPLFERPDEACTVVGIAISFPESESDATIEYVVGSVGELGGGDS